MKLSSTIKKIIITEKSMIQRDKNNNYFFKVSKNATKDSIALEIERIFSVNVEKVRTLVIPGKRKRVRRTNWLSHRPNWKKAVVSLKEGQKITLGMEK